MLTAIGHIYQVKTGVFVEPKMFSGISFTDDLLITEKVGFRIGEVSVGGKLAYLLCL